MYHPRPLPRFAGRLRSAVASTALKMLPRRYRFAYVASFTNSYVQVLDLEATSLFRLA